MSGSGPVKNGDGACTSAQQSRSSGYSFLDEIDRQNREYDEGVEKTIPDIEPPSYTGINEAREILLEKLSASGTAEKTLYRQVMGFGTIDALTSDRLDLDRVEAEFNKLLEDGIVPKETIVRAYYRLVGTFFMIPDQILPELVFEHPKAGRFLGLFLPTEWKVFVDMDGDEQLETIRHELKHVQQSIRGAVLDRVDVHKRPPAQILAGIRVYYPSTSDSDLLSELAKEEEEISRQEEQHLEDAHETDNKLLGQAEALIGDERAWQILKELGQKVGPFDEIFMEAHSFFT